MTRALRTGETSIPPRAGMPSQEQRVETPSGDTVIVTQGGSPSSAPHVEAELIGARDGHVRGSAVDPEDVNQPDEEPPVVERWIVLRDANFTDNGHRVKVTRGKILDTLNYKIPHLLKQGVRLKKLEPDDDGSEFLMAEHG